MWKSNLGANEMDVFGEHAPRYAEKEHEEHAQPTEKHTFFLESVWLHWRCHLSVFEHSSSFLFGCKAILMDVSSQDYPPGISFIDSARITEKSRERCTSAFLKHPFKNSRLNKAWWSWWSIWWFPKIGVPPNHPFIDGRFPYKLSTFGYPHLWKPPSAFVWHWTSKQNMWLNARWSRRGINIDFHISIRLMPLGVKRLRSWTAWGLAMAPTLCGEEFKNELSMSLKKHEVQTTVV